MSDRYRIEEIDVREAGDDVLRARWEAICEIESELSPEDPTVPFDQHRLELLNIPSHRKPRFLVGWDGDAKHVIGYGTLYLEYTESNRHLAWFDLAVREPARRQGLGTSLLARLTELSQLDARSVVGSGSIDGHAGDGFAEAMGFEKKATERKSRLLTANVDRELMDRWIKAAQVEAEDYVLVSYDDVSPDELVDEMVDLYHVTNTAPRDDLDMEDEVMTPERFREGEEKMVATNTKRWRVLVRHSPTGQLAGFTELFFAPYSDRVAWQGWTAVRPEHRRHGLGRWLKAVNILRLMDEKPEVEAVDTWNAFSNGPMLGINISMGFELVRGYNDWQAPTDRVAELTKSRLNA